MKIHDLNGFCLLFLFSEEQDKNMVMQEGSWVLMGSFLLVKKWDHDSTMEQVDLTHTEMWVQVQNIPSYYLTFRNAQKITSIFKCDFHGIIELCIEGLVLRIKVSVDVNAPLIVRFHLQNLGKP